LVDPNLQRKIVGAVGAGPEDEVLEIGPGRGALTRHLVGTVRRLVLVELDDDLAEKWRREYADRDDVVVVHGDVLQTDLGAVLESPADARVVGNIPYNITSPIIFKLLGRPRPRDIVLMVQAEVADRITADVGTKSYGALSVGVRSIASAKRLFGVGRGAFRPVPGVDSAVLRITPKQPPPLDVQEEEALREVVRGSFQWRRKQLQKILRDHPDLRVPAGELGDVAERAGIELSARPETLSPEAFIRLSAALPDR
jgi:16S rRNA (adenine1518-N6/adenine1519-N6)-dimethyltransferase